MNATRIRSEHDAALAETLLRDKDIRRSIERLERELEKSDRSGATRRHLLSTSVRLSEALAPDVHQVLRACQQRLGVETDLELYVYPSPQLNAACVRPEAGRVFIMFSSELLESFNEQELAFVAGHELGHHVFDHHDIPVGALLRGKYAVSPRLALQLFAWSRYAEISADRAGLMCCDDLDAVARGLFKLASGLRDGAAHVVMEALLEQVEDIKSLGMAKGDDRPRADWFSTHPFSPLRLVAAKLFASSEVMQEGGITTAQLELEVQKTLAIMEPGYLKETTEEAELMRRLLLAGSMVVAAASGDVSDVEIEAIEAMLGEGKVTRHLSVPALRDDLPARIRAVNDLVPPARRAQVLRDLCVIALADGHADGAERAQLREIAESLEVAPELVAQTLDASVDLD